jgi:hypothetical protein
VKELSSGAGVLLVCCFDLEEPPYRGMSAALRELEEKPDFQWRAWDETRLDLEERKDLAHVVLSGHGSETQARLGDGVSRFLYPGDLGMPPGRNLYLLGCFQGREDLASLWARDTGLPMDGVFGAEGETETLLSTMFLLHLAAEGFSRIGRLFGDWVLANRIIRPLFAEARAFYAETGGDPLKVLDFLSSRLDLTPVLSFLDIAKKRADVLSGLLPRTR